MQFGCRFIIRQEHRSDARTALIRRFLSARPLLCARRDRDTVVWPRYLMVVETEAYLTETTRPAILLAGPVPVSL
jgi:hypothetical protein